MMCLFCGCVCRYSFDYHPGEVYWCTADIGWITGHSYITYGPMANGATSVLVSITPPLPYPIFNHTLRLVHFGTMRFEPCLTNTRCLENDLEQIT